MSSNLAMSAVGVFSALSRILDSVDESRRSKLSLELLVHQPGSVGPTPAIGIERLAMGFDWDRNRILAKPLSPITLLTPKDVEEISASVRRGTSYHAYQQYRSLQTQIQQLQADNARLAAENAELKARAADED